MHLVKIKFDPAKLQDVASGWTNETTNLLAKIPRIGEADGEWVSAMDVKSLIDLYGDVVEGVEEIDFKSNKSFTFGRQEIRAIPALMPLVREIAEVLEYKKVYVCGQTSFEKYTAEVKTDPERLFIILDDCPAELNPYTTRVSKLRFGVSEITVPSAIGYSFRTINRTNDSVLMDNLVKDDDDILIGVFHANRIYCTFNLAGVVGKAEVGWFPGLVVRELVQRALAKQSLRGNAPQNVEERETTLEKCRGDFIQHCKSDVDDAIAELEQRVRQLTNDIAELEKQVLEKMMQIRDCNIKLTGLKNEDDKKSHLNKQFDMIKSHIPLLRSMTFTEGGLTFETEVIHLEGDSATRNPQKFDPFPLGRYRIRMKRGQDIHVTNLTRRLEYEFYGRKDMWDHPHVKNHLMCLGNIKTKVNQLILQDKWFPAITYIIEALKNYNSNDGWSPIGLPHWQKAAKDEVVEFEFDERRARLVRQWVGFRQTLPLNIKAKIGDKVVAKCPDACPLKGAKACKVQGNHRHEGTVQELYDNHVAVKWEDEEGRDVQCPAFTYDTVKQMNGEPIIDGFYQPGRPDGIQMLEDYEMLLPPVNVKTEDVPPGEVDTRWVDRPEKDIKDVDIIKDFDDGLEENEEWTF